MKLQFIDKMSAQELLDFVNSGNEIIWYDGDVKHSHSLAKPHPHPTAVCNGECCNQEDNLSELIRTKNATEEA